MGRPAPPQQMPTRSSLRMFRRAISLRNSRCRRQLMTLNLVTPKAVLRASPSSRAPMRFMVRLTTGSSPAGGVRNVFAENCHFDSPNLWMALRFKNNALRGGRLENFYYRNIEAGQVRDAVLTVDFNYEEGEKGPFTPVVRKVVVTNLRSGKGARVLDLQGFKTAPIYDVHLENCTFANVAQLSAVKNVQGLELRTVRINGKLADNPLR